MEIFKGIIEFREKDFEHLKEHFRGISFDQKPHTLFIGCSDSRVVPSLITKTLPGDLFVIRNIANIVPSKSVEFEDSFVSTTSSLEYAIEKLNVKSIVVCGHSNCGGCMAIWDDYLEESFPLTNRWLKLMEGVKNKVQKHFEGREPSPEEREWVTEQYNIVEQISHLLTYPEIAEKYDRGELVILGLYYVIGTGEVYNFNKDTNIFELVK